MKKSLLLVMAVIVVGALLVGIGYVASASVKSPGTASVPFGGVGYSASESQTVYNYQTIGIWVSGVGTVTAVPDVAILSLGVETRASTVQAAMDEAATAMDRVMAALLAAGVAKKDIQTQWFDVSPITDWVEVYSTEKWVEGHEVIIGYRVTNMVTAKIRNVEAVGDVIDSAADAGGDLIQIHGVSFTIDDTSAYMSQARQLAVADARAKAQQLASLAGVGLGSAFYISESSGYYPVYSDYYVPVRGEASVTTPISAGETTITLTIQIAFSIQ